MHVTKECFSFYNIAFSVPLNSKYKVAFERKIVKAVEAGLVKKYTEIELDKAAKKGKSAKSEADATPLSIDHMQAPFLLLPMLLGICLIIFFIEYAIGK